MIEGTEPPTTGRKRWPAWLLLAAAAGALVALLSAGGVQRRRVADDLKADHPAVRAAAVRALARAGRQDLLLGALADPDADVRLLVVERLGGPGPGAEDRVRALVKALADPHGGVRREAANTLCALGPEAAPALYEALEDYNPRVRAGAAWAFQGKCALTPKEPRRRAAGEVKRILPVLCRLTRDPDVEVRRNAVRALRGLREVAPEDGPDQLRALREACEDADPKVREEASRTFRKD
jgi:HEAT repeat protein